MSQLSLNAYAERARLIADETVATGRRPIDRDVMPVIRADILTRLRLNGRDRLLDIGSGLGALTIPVSYFVGSVTAVDHQDVLARMLERPNIEKVPGDFLTLDLRPRTFTKALAYSMIHYLSDRADIEALIDKALFHLEDDGLLLLGDVPNDTYRERSVATYSGQKMVMDIGLRMVQMEAEKQRIEKPLSIPEDLHVPMFDDDFILSLLARVRRMGHHAWALPQTHGLPFAHVREDILIQKLVPAPVRDLFVAQAITNGRFTYVGLSMREVESFDCDLIYAWSQDPLVRRMSTRQEPFTIEQHREWFARKMDERIPKDVRWYMLEESARVPVGWARYERVRRGRPLWTGGPEPEEDGGTEVSIVIAPQMRGMKLGPMALNRSEVHARKVMPYPLIALMRPENTPSIRAFEASGYQYVRDEERLGVQLRRYEKVRDERPVGWQMTNGALATLRRYEK